MPMINVNEQELAFLLAAGRMAQAEIETYGVLPDQYQDIATDGDTITPLYDDQVDDLLERMNFEGDSNDPDQTPLHR